MKIGIGITTRQRTHILELCLFYWALYLPKCEFEFVVIHDACDQDYTPVIERYPFVKYYKNPERLGIAKSKNECLKRLKDCDYIFLCDDDVFPVSAKFYDFYIDNHKRTGIHHFLYQVNLPFVAKLDEKDGIGIYAGCGGVMMFLTQEVLRRVGAFDDRFTAPYGYEHGNYTGRIFQAGLTNGLGPYLCPVGADQYFYSLDYDLNNRGIRPPLHPDFVRDTFTSSIAGEEWKVPHWINENIRYLNDYSTIYREIK